MPTVLPTAGVSTEITSARPADSIAPPEDEKTGFRHLLPSNSPTAAVAQPEKTDAVGVAAKTTATLNLSASKPPDAVPETLGRTAVRPFRIPANGAASKRSAALKKDLPSAEAKSTTQSAVPLPLSGLPPTAAIIMPPRLPGPQPTTQEETTPPTGKIFAAASSSPLQQMQPGFSHAVMRMEATAATATTVQADSHASPGSARAQAGANMSLALSIPAPDGGATPVSFSQSLHGAQKSKEISGQIANALTDALPNGVFTAQPRLALHVALTPQHLGTVTVKVAHDASGSVNVTVTATQPETLATLKKDIDSINQILTTAGLPESGRHLQFEAAQVVAPQASAALANNPNVAQGGTGHHNGQRNGTGLANNFSQTPIDATPGPTTAPGFARSGVDMFA